MLYRILSKELIGLRIKTIADSDKVQLNGKSRNMEVDGNFACGGVCIGIIAGGNATLASMMPINVSKSPERAQITRQLEGDRFYFYFSSSVQ